MSQRCSGIYRRSLAALALMLSAGPGFAQNYGVPERIVGPAPFLGVHGLAIDKQGILYAGSVTGATLHQVDRHTGKVETLVEPPQGMADDIAIAPDGTMAWTGFLTGMIHARKGDGPIKVLARGLPGINSLAYNGEGRLFATQVFLDDALYEIATDAEQPPRKIMEGMGGLNGFEFGIDGWLYGPLWFKGQIVKINVDNGELRVVSDGFKTPAAANFGPKGDLFVVDAQTGELLQVDVESGSKKQVAQLAPALDNLAVDASGTIFVSNMADNSIQEIDPDSKKVRMIVQSKLAAPAGIVLVGDTLHVADTFAYRTVDIETGEVQDIKRMQASDLEYPISATAKDDIVILSSWFTGTVQIIERNTGATRKMLHDFAAPHDVIELPDGNLLVAELGTGSLLKVSGEGRSRTAVVKNLQGPAGLVLASGGEAVYMTEAGGKVSAVDIADWSVRLIAEGLKLPEGITLTPQNRLVVVEVGAQRIIEIDPESGTTTVVAENLPIGRPGLPGIPPTHMFSGIAVSMAGDVYFTSDLEGSVYRIPQK